MSTPTFSPASQLVRVTEVARHLSLSRSKIYQMMDRGELPYVKLGKSRRVRWPDVERLVEQNTISRS
ncbi:MAG: helix-turn-helix domain-containing protein [Pirellulales bacterium]|jgi:excisionase family DNA binding protein